MEERQRKETLQAMFRELILPLASAYLAVKRFIHWDEEEKALKVGDKSYLLSEIGSIYLVGAGKAGVPMSRGVVEILQGNPLLWQKFQGGVVNVYRDQAGEKVPGVKFFAADHPNPNQASVEGAKSSLDILRKTRAGDLVVAVISGGGSSLLTFPANSIGLKEFRITNELLVTGGASIQEINTVRKHLSQVKGGKLRMAAPEANFLTLILSDVIGDDLSSIASGPTVADFSTFQGAIQVLKKYQLWEKIPAEVRLYLRRGIEGKEEETLKGELWEKKLANHTYNFLVASNSFLLKALDRELRSPGYREIGQLAVDFTPVTGKVEEAVEKHFHQAKELFEKVKKDGISRILLCGGESTVKVPEYVKGRGGRNQHYALLAAQKITGYPWTVLSAGTDGIDGNSPAAGAIVDGSTITLAREKGVNPEESLADFDSYGFFEKLEERSGQRFLIRTGPTGTNVNDTMLWWMSRSVSEGPK